jgi:hypothetical protein
VRLNPHLAHVLLGADHLDVCHRFPPKAEKSPPSFVRYAMKIRRVNRKF